ncbi:MAG TPA: ABC transporter permease [Aggregatilineales bacterium]|nr:ABC transporter permease [Anaerolineales bacterium]HRE47753.1 ABC transporter permease [Aggregatilineales bacterium]
MNDSLLVAQLAVIVAGGAPLVLAAVGETFSERAGIVNLSLDGSLMLAALAAFVFARGTNSLVVGAVAGMMVGMVAALIVAFASIELRQSQVAVGFVLALLCKDMAIFFGASHRSEAGLSIPYLTIPVLSDIPFLGGVFFRQNIFAYLSFLAVFAAWVWIYRTKAGLALRAVGERPETAFARGTAVNRARYLYAALGGLLVGLGGAAYTLSVTTTWLESQIAGNGWIALAIVIFGGWHPLRVALGVYLVAALRGVVTGLQGQIGRSVLELLNALPWVLMLLTLVAVSRSEWLVGILPARLQPMMRSLLRARPPTALGTRFEQEG